MNLDDIINFLRDESDEQTLTEQAITRCVLLAYEMGIDSGRGEAHAMLHAAHPPSPWPLCGERSFLSTHLTTDAARVTCPACLLALAHLGERR